MNLRLGKTGGAEGACAAAIAMTVGGIFTVDSARLYSRGNAAYLTLPLAALLSLAVFMLSAEMLEKSGAKNLGELIKRAFGAALFPIFALLMFLALTISAYAPLAQFVRAMHALFFDGVSYSKVVVFTLPAVFALALCGFETVARTAKLFAFPLFAVLAASIAASFSEFELYRLYPLPGSGAASIAAQTLSLIGAFLPALLCLLVNADGLNGARTARRAGLIAALFAAGTVFIAQFALSLVYTYVELGEKFMPLFRMSYLNKFEAHFMRMDKLAHMLWLSGGMIAGAYYLYSGARLTSQGFDMRDVRPTILGGAALMMLLIMLEVESAHTAAFARLKEAWSEWCFLFVSALPLAAGIAAKARAGRLS